ncbi:hypothetical protein HZH66_008983 [Vespula vulgaris]|uniref:Uncharacterized protein n=1 Tax=Vespula vulgaris TaxID=7454 RepID=A0A834N1G3_VESVU|nr:hypothetical protein HZH66_008983 [Vespula vulgaris]
MQEFVSITIGGGVGHERISGYRCPKVLKVNSTRMLVWSEKELRKDSTLATVQAKSLLKDQTLFIHLFRSPRETYLLIALKHSTKWRLDYVEQDGMLVGHFTRTLWTP